LSRWRWPWRGRPASGGAATGVTPGSTTATGCTSQLLLADGSSLLNCDSGLTYDTSINTMAIPFGAGATFGSDVVVNGTFTGNATGWTLGGGGGAPDWAYATNNVTHGNSGGTTALQPSTPLTVVSGHTYKVQFTLSSWSAGTVTSSIGGTSGSAVGANLTFSETLTAASTANLLFTPTTTLVATIDTISVQDITATASEALRFTAGNTGLSVRTGPSATRTFCLSGSSDSGNAGCKWLGTGSSNDLFFGDGSGAKATTAVGNTCFGHFSCLGLTNGANNVCFGASCLQVNKAGLRNTSMGVQALGGSGDDTSFLTDNTALGYQSGQLTTGNFNVFLGSLTGRTGQIGSYTLAAGYGAFNTASNQFVLGGDPASAGFTEGYLGHGVVKVSPENFNLRGTGGSGSNNAGSKFTITPGVGTGTAAGGDMVLQGSPSIGTGSTLQSGADALYIRSQFKTLTPATATAFARVNIAQAVAGINGWYGGTVFYTIIANTAAAAVVQAYVGSVNFACTNLAGTETCSFGTPSSPADNTPTGAITAPTFDANAGTDTIDLRINTDSDQTETTLGMFWSLIGNGTATITPQ
jgi:hypothetical protein